MDELKIKYMAPGKLKPWDRNPKAHNDQALKASVSKFGPRQPLIIQKGTNRIIAGHGRLKAYMDHGMDKVPVLEWDCTEEEAAAYAIADNQLTISMGWDHEALTDILAEIADYEEDFMDALGFNGPELDFLFGRNKEEEVKEEGLKNLEFKIDYTGEPERYKDIQGALGITGNNIDRVTFEAMVDKFIGGGL